MMKSIAVVLLVNLIIAAAAAAGGGGFAGLSLGYYELTCPNLEAIVHKALLPIFLTDPRSPAAFLRLFFHDCQVQGCDASILLDIAGGEMESSKNFGIRNRESIALIKALVEVECPGTVSCADIVVLAAREAVAYSGGPRIIVPLGRKDSTVASNRRADASLPSGSAGVDDALRLFSVNGLSLEESVAILGAHSIGVGHCINIVNRLYDAKQHSQGNIDYAYEALLRLKCPTRVPYNNETFILNDLTAALFDNQYYRNVLGGRGLFTVDVGISVDPQTSPIVRLFAVDQAAFFRSFSLAFVKISSLLDVNGEGGTDQIRRVCNRVNY